MKRWSMIALCSFLVFSSIWIPAASATTNSALPLPKPTFKPSVKPPAKPTARPSQKPAAKQPKTTAKPSQTPVKPSAAVTSPQKAAQPVNPFEFVDSQVASGLNVPVTMSFSPDGRLFVAEKGGKIRIIKNGTLLSDPFLQIAVDDQGERGLLGMAFDPDYATNSFFYVYHTVPGYPAFNRVSRFKAASPLSDTSDPNSQTTIFNLSPLSDALIHNGGAIHFGLDGKLYVATGENANPNHSQDLSNSHGKLLRINKDGSIPADNPFYNTVSGIGRAVWQLGHRNPFTFAVQPGTGRMFVNDVGKDSWEEIDEAVKGGNFGWPVVEGPSNDARYVSPFYAYDHSVGRCIAGGVFYNPEQAMYPADYIGDYFMADFESGWIKRLDGSTKQLTDFAGGLTYPVDVKVSKDGVLYYLEIAGNVGKITYQSNVSTNWSGRDIGMTGQAGSYSQNGTTFTVRGSGADIWGNADGFHYVSRALEGDGQITAKLVSMQNTDPWAKAGVMIRESYADQSRHAMVSQTFQNGTEFGYRSETGGSTTTLGSISAAPQWLRLVRTGNLFKGFRSNDGESWTLVSETTVNMGSAATAGLAVTAHNNNLLNQAVFESVSVEQAGPLTITSQPANVSIAVGQEAMFSVSTSGIGALNYQWYRNGAPISGATASSYRLSNAQPTDSGAKFKVTVSNGQGSVTSSEATLSVSTNQAPVPVIHTPVAGSLYKAGVPVSFSGSASDPEDGNLPLSSLTWKVDMHHDSHTHPVLASTTGYGSGTITIPAIGETSPNVWLRIYLTAKDSGGREQTVYTEIQPVKSVITLQSDPAGAQLTLDGTPVTAPYTFTGVAGTIRTIGLTAQQTINTQPYTFSGWSDRLAQTHEITTPDTAATYTAAFQAAPVTNNSVKVYYKRIVSSGTQYVHYQPAGGSWTTAPGVAMTDSEVPGYAVALLNIGSSASVQAAFNVNGNNWDSRGGLNYAIPSGTYTVENGALKQGAPLPPAPDTTAPGVPSNVNASGKTANSISLRWNPSTDNVGVTGYEIFRNGSRMATSSITSFTDSGLSASTAYIYTIKAYDAAGNVSEGSVPLSVTTDAAGAINTVTVYYKRLINSGTQFIHYRPAGGSWTAAPGVAMTASEVSGYEKAILTIGTATQLEAAFNVNGNNWDSRNGANYLIPTGTQTVENGTVKAGAPSSGQPSDTASPTVPGNVQSSGKTSSSVTLSWTASSDNVGVTGYEIFRNAVKAGTSTSAGFTDSGLQPDTVYEYTVKAYDAAGNVSAASAPLQVSTNALPPQDALPPDAPANLAVTGKTETTVSFSWSASTDNVGVTGYEIFRNGSKAGTATGISFTDTGLSASTTYNYTVSALDGAGNRSAASAVLSARTNDPAPQNQVTVYYKRSFNGGTQYIHYRPAGGSWTAAPGVAMSASEVTGYEKITLSIGTASQIEACFNVNNSNWDSRGGSNYLIPSGIQTVENGTVRSGAPAAPEPDTSAPTVPAGLQSTAKTSSAVTLAWTVSTDNRGVAGYEVFRNGSKIGTTQSLTFTDSGLSPSTAYSYSVKAYDAAGNVSAASNALSVTTNAASAQNSVTIHYKRKIATGTQYMHYRPNGGAWTSVPGAAMTNSANGYAVITVNIGTVTGIEAVFNVNGSNWDNNNNQNYRIGSGTWTIDNGVIRAGTP